MQLISTLDIIKAKMINIEKTKIYLKYDGDLDGWCRIQNKDDRIINEDEWRIIDDIIGNIVPILRGLAAEKFIQENKKLVKRNLQDEATFKLIEEYAKQKFKIK